MSFEDDLMDVAEFVEMVNEERQKTLRNADLTVATVAEIQDRRDRR